MSDFNIDGISYRKINRNAVVGDTVISSEQIGHLARIYVVTAVFSSGVVGRYSRGAYSMRDYAVVEQVSDK